jgi:hypothetical protein
MHFMRTTAPQPANPALRASNPGFALTRILVRGASTGKAVPLSITQTKMTQSFSTVL